MATSAPHAGVTKITARLFEPMYADFDRQIADALLRRDAFLDRVISCEIGHLRTDLTGKRLSDKAKRYVAGRLKSLGGKDSSPLRQVSIAVRQETANALRVVVAEHNLVRDAFINWLITLLRSSDKLLECLDLPTRVTTSRRDGTQDMPTGPIKAIEETQLDPFYYLRSACQERHGCGL